MLVDTHCHLNFRAFKDDVDEVVKRTLDAGMKVINVGSQYSTSKRAVDLACQHIRQLYAAVALHPIHLFDVEVDEDEVKFHSRKEEFDRKQYEELAKDPGVVAIGENGLDYYRFPEGVDQKEVIAKQKDTFRKHLDLARDLELPFIVHCRSPKQKPDWAYEDIVEILKEYPGMQGVIHCFTASIPVARQFLDIGFHISFTGIITFPNAKDLVEVVKYVPLDRILVETDAPYLAPQQYRGKRNEPLYVRHVAEKIAEVKGVSYNEVEAQTTKNAVALFRLE